MRFSSRTFMQQNFCFYVTICIYIYFEHLLPSFCSPATFQLVDNCLLALLAFSLFHVAILSCSWSTSINCKSFLYSIEVLIDEDFVKPTLRAVNWKSILSWMFQKQGEAVLKLVHIAQQKTRRCGSPESCMARF